jgi:NAD(P)-dependent dehydrogenase (short-subunit alcohol dehydrogenase family)
VDLQLAGKTAVVTGGSRGIGKAIARLLLEEGATVAIVARGAEALEATAAELAAASTPHQRRVLAVTADTGDTTSVTAMAERVLSELGRVDILVNCAARPGGAPAVAGIENLPDETFTTEMNTKVLGYLRCARAFVPSMKANGWGRIINVSGLAARQTGNAIGSMRNVAVAALTKNLADELGPFGINVTCVHPGLTWTEGVEQSFRSQAEARGEALDDARQRLASQNTVRRVIDSSDIASVVAFLASPLSVAITGDSIAAGGGVGRAIHY